MSGPHEEHPQNYSGQPAKKETNADTNAEILIAVAASDLRPLIINTSATGAHIDLDHPLILNGERRPDVPLSTPCAKGDVNAEP